LLALLGNDDITHHRPAYGIEAGPPSNWTWTQSSPPLSEQISESRRAKDSSEIALMRRAADASRAGHLAALRLARAGMSERQLQIELEAEFFRHGAERTAYGSIVGTGSNGAVLHFSPTSRALQDGEIVLIDAGAEVGGYASDVTRTFPVGPRLEGIQRDLYQLVLDVQQAAIGEDRPVVEYRDLHLLVPSASRAAGHLGILRGNPADCRARRHALFFPHGLGTCSGSHPRRRRLLKGRTPSDRSASNGSAPTFP